ncbi:MAG: hypothetical protein WA888_16035 [Burkholderiaceae bacterium]
MNKTLLLATLTIVGVLSAGCTSGPTAADSPHRSMTTSSEKPMLVVSDQALADYVTIDVLVLQKPGFVVIHADADGKPGEVIGHSSELPVGRHANLTIDINPKKAGLRVFPMIHTDNGDGAYVFPGPDAPTVVDGEVLVGVVNWK